MQSLIRSPAVYPVCRALLALGSGGSQLIQRFWPFFCYDGPTFLASSWCPRGMHRSLILNSGWHTEQFFFFISGAHFMDGGIDSSLSTPDLIWICFCMFIMSMHRFSYLWYQHCFIYTVSFSLHFIFAYMLSLVLPYLHNFKFTYLYYSRKKCSSFDREFFTYWG